MATIREHTSTDGRTTYSVLFRHHSRQTSRTFTTRRTAEKFRLTIEALGVDKALEGEVIPSTHQGTLDELAERYFTWKSSRVRSDRTVADYRRDYNNWISPALGHRLASSIAAVDVQTLVDDMGTRPRPGRRNSQPPLSAKSITDRHAILHGIFKWATAPSRRFVMENPCVGTELPRRRRGQAKGLRPNEWVALHSALQVIDSHAADLALFCCRPVGVGLRQQP